MNSTVRRVLIVIVAVAVGAALVALAISKFREATFYPG
jgi:hypothetical protein